MTGEERSILPLGLVPAWEAQEEVCGTPTRDCSTHPRLGVPRVNGIVDRATGLLIAALALYTFAYYWTHIHPSNPRKGT